MSEPTHVGPAVGGNLPVSSQDRQQVISQLDAAASDGLLSVVERDMRVNAALQAVDYDDLVPLTRDLPQQVELVPHSPMPVPTVSGRKSKLGIAAFIMMVVATIAGCWSSYAFGSAYAQLAVQYVAGFDPSIVSEEETLLLGSDLVLGMIATVVAVIALVLGIIAVAKNKGKGFGIITIILGLLAPLAIFILFMVLLFPVV